MPDAYGAPTAHELIDRGDGSAVINVNDHRALLEELRHLAMNHGATGMQSPSLRQRLRAYHRVAWLAARLAWLDTDDYLAATGELARVDTETTGPIPRVPLNVPAVDYAQAQVWRT